MQCLVTIVRAVAMPLMALACLALVMTTGRAEADQPAVAIVFDGSGSMWGKIEGDRRARFHVAREALKQAMSKLPAETGLGLLAFGHRRGDCEDVETTVQMEPGSAEKIGAALEKLNPRGKGPIAAALREAAGSFAASASQPQSIILIHDDADNCRGDPCAVAAEIHKSHPRLKVHVVSVATRKDDQSRIACVAKLTGGRHFDGTSADQLATAIEEAVRIATREPPRPSTPAPAKADPAAASPQAKTLPGRKRDGPPGLLLAVALSASGEPLDIPLRWRIARRGEDKAIAESEQPAPTVPLPPGSYVVSVTTGTIRREAAFDVRPDRPTEATVVLDGGLLVIARPTGQAKESRSALFTVLGADGSPLLITRDPVIALAAGSYTLVAEEGLARVRTPFAVKAGAQTALDASLSVGHLRLALSLREGGPPVDTAQFVVYEDDPDAPQGRREVMRTAAPQPELTLPVGTYYVIARHGGAEARERIALRPGETIERTLVASAGRVTLATRMAAGDAPPELVSYRIVRLDVTGAEPLLVSRPAAVIELAGGRYRIEGRLGGLNARITREIEVKAGGAQTVALDHKAGLAHLRLIDTGTGIAIADAFWEIRNDAGQLIWATSQAEPRAPLLAGRYSIRAEQRGRVATATVELRAGERRTVEIQLK